MSYVHRVSDNSSSDRHECASEQSFQNIIGALQRALNFYSSRVDDLFQKARKRLNIDIRIIPDNPTLPFSRRLSIIRANLRRIFHVPDDPSIRLDEFIRTQLYPKD